MCTKVQLNDISKQMVECYHSVYGLDSLTKYRLDNALEKMESAKLLLDAGKYKDFIRKAHPRQSLAD